MMVFVKRPVLPFVTFWWTNATAAATTTSLCSLLYLFSLVNINLLTSTSSIPWCCACFLLVLPSFMRFMSMGWAFFQRWGTLFRRLRFREGFSFPFAFFCLHVNPFFSLRGCLHCRGLNALSFLHSFSRLALLDRQSRFLNDRFGGRLLGCSPFSLSS